MLLHMGGAPKPKRLVTPSKSVKPANLIRENPCHAVWANEQRVRQTRPWPELARRNDDRRWRDDRLGNLHHFSRIVATGRLARVVAGGVGARGRTHDHGRAL